MRPRITRGGAIALIYCAMSVGITACGSDESGSGTVAEKVSTAAEAAKTQATGAAKETESSPQTKTVEKTVTESAPAASGSSTVQTAPTTTASSQSDDGGLEWWAWVLIGVAAAGVLVAAFAAGRHRSSPPGDPVAEPTSPEPGPPAGTPPA